MQQQVKLLKKLQLQKMSNPYRKMYLVSEDEYISMGKHPEQQQRLNAMALQDECNM